MAFREDLTKRIEKKKQEIAELQANLREATSYLQALEDTIRMLPRDERSDAVPTTRPDFLRPNSAVARARDLIRAAGQPLHVDEMLKRLGKPLNKGNKAALSGSIAAYVRRGEIFVKTAPNTFGLKDGREKSGSVGGFREDELPDSFGFETESDSSDMETAAG